MNIHHYLPLVFNAILLIYVIVHIVSLAQKKKVQDRLIESLEKNASSTWFRVVIARPTSFAKRLKFFPYEARGVLVHTPEHIRILAELSSGEKIDRTIEKSHLALTWNGNVGLSSSNLHWIMIGTGDESLYLSADTGWNAMASRQATADLCRIIASDLALPTVAIQEFALEKNPASLTIIILFFLWLGFGMLDGLILNKNELVTGDAWLEKILAIGPFGALLLATPAYWWLTRRQVPSRESVVLTMLLGVAIGLSAIPFAKRIDQCLSQSGPTSIAYRLGERAVLEPVNASSPKLHYEADIEYWAQFPVGSIHHFTLTHGPLGLWQVDRTQLNEELSKFYNEFYKNTNGAKAKQR